MSNVTIMTKYCKTIFTRTLTYLTLTKFYQAKGTKKLIISSYFINRYKKLELSDGEFWLLNWTGLDSPEIGFALHKISRLNDKRLQIRYK